METYLSRALEALCSKDGLQVRYAREALHEATSASTLELERGSLARAETHLTQALIASGSEDSDLVRAYLLTRKARRDALD